MNEYLAPEELRAPVCERKGCNSVVVITEVVFGHRLTLCKDHGRDVEDLLRNGYDSFYEWTQEWLKIGVRNRWKRRKRKSAPEEKVRKRKSRRKEVSP